MRKVNKPQKKNALNTYQINARVKKTYYAFTIH